MQRVLTVLVGVGLIMLSACEQADPNSAAFWIEKLKTAERPAAIQKLAAMKSKEGVKPLMEAYKDGRSKYEIVAALTQIGDHDAIPTLLEALQDTSAAQAGQLAATTLLEWGAKEHTDVYINVASNKSAPNELRYGALQLLSAFPVAKAEQPLLSILSVDPDLQPIAFNGLAAEALGKLQSTAAVPGLIACQWLDDHLHRNEVPKCRLALARIGPKAAVPEVIKTLERKNRTVEDRARKYKYNIGGLIEAKMAEVLGDMPDPSAVDALIAALKKTEEMPVSVQNDPQKAQFFVMGGVQRVISSANALALIGDERAVEPLLEVAGASELALEHKLTATQQLAFLGSPAAIVGTKQTPGLQALLDKKIGQYDPVSQGFRVQVALALGNLFDGSDAKAMETFEKSIAAIQAEIDGWIKTAQEAVDKKDDKSAGAAQDLKAYQEWHGNYAEALAKLAATRECTNDPACWGKKLSKDEKNIAVRMLAGYRLAQMKDAKATAVKILMENVRDPDLTLRNVILFGLDRLADSSVIPELEKLRAEDAELAKKDKRYQGAAYTDELMIAKLSHKTN